MQGSSILQPDDDTYPSWGHWHSESKHLPVSFHSKDGFAELERSLKLPLPEETYHHLEQFSLVVGLALQDINTVVVQDDKDLVPEWINKSPLRERHIKRLLKCCPPTILDKQAVNKPLQVFPPPMRLKQQLNNHDHNSSLKRKYPPRSGASEVSQRSPKFVASHS